MTAGQVFILFGFSALCFWNVNNTGENETGFALLCMIGGVGSGLVGAWYTLDWISGLG